MLEIEQAIYLKQNVNFLKVQTISKTDKIPGGNLPFNGIFVIGKCLEVSKMAIQLNSGHQITKHQHPHLQRQCEITILVTNQNIHYSFPPVAFPSRVYSQTDAPKSQGLR